MEGYSRGLQGCLRIVCRGRSALVRFESSHRGIEDLRRPFLDPQAGPGGPGAIDHMRPAGSAGRGVSEARASSGSPLRRALVGGLWGVSMVVRERAGLAWETSGDAADILPLT